MHQPTPAERLAWSLATHAGTDFDDLPTIAQAALTQWAGDYLRWLGTIPKSAMPATPSPPTPEYLAARNQHRLRAAVMSEEDS